MKRWLIAFFLTLAAGTSHAQAVTADPFAQTSQWRAEESWNKDALIYKFDPHGTFVSSDWDNGKGQGTWVREGASLTMNWPQYKAVYRGAIDKDEIRGTAYWADGRTLGTFVLHLIR